MDRSKRERPADALSASAQAGFDETLDGGSGLLGARAGGAPDGSATTDRVAADGGAGRPVVTVRATRLGRFTLLHQLGTGGMPAV